MNGRASHIAQIIWSIAGIVLGIATLVVGCWLYSEKGYGSSLDSVTFGGDFYTEIHKAVRYLNGSVRTLYLDGMSALISGFILSGLLEVVVFGKKLTDGIIMYIGTASAAGQPQEMDSLFRYLEGDNQAEQTEKIFHDTDKDSFSSGQADTATEDPADGPVS